MFWRIVRRLLIANRGRLVVILLALGAGAAVTAALLNIQVDAKRRLTTEFRTFGANIIVAPRDSASSATATLDESIVRQIPRDLQTQRVGVHVVLYVVAAALDTHTGAGVVVAGVSGDDVPALIADGPTASYQSGYYVYEPRCLVGVSAANNIHPHVASLLEQGGGSVTLRSGDRTEKCTCGVLPSTGGSEDNQVIVPLAVAQRLAALPGRVSLIEITAPGTPDAINNYISDLQKILPDADVHGIRQFTEAEAKIYTRISGLLTATVAVVLILTTLCVMAAMTNVAMERKNDVGLMKAIGGATRRVLRLFLAEAAVLGLVGGILGAAAGILISIGLGKAVFGVAAQPRLIVYPVAVALTIVVALAGAYPLRRLAGIRPASVFRGE
jgi:putative ABC transport system permease protein